VGLPKKNDLFRRSRHDHAWQMMCMKIRCAHQALVLNLVCIPAQEYLGTTPWQTPLLGSLPYPLPSVQGKQK